MSSYSAKIESPTYTWRCLRKGQIWSTKQKKRRMEAPCRGTSDCFRLLLRLRWQILFKPNSIHLFNFEPEDNEPENDETFWMITFGCSTPRTVSKGCFFKMPYKIQRKPSAMACGVTANASGGYQEGHLRGPQHNWVDDGWASHPQGKQEGCLVNPSTSICIVSYHICSTNGNYIYYVYYIIGNICALYHIYSTNGLVWCFGACESFGFDEVVGPLRIPIPENEGMRNPKHQHKPPINPQLIYDLRIIYDEVFTIDQPKYSSLVFGVCFLYVWICKYMYIH